MVSRQVVMTSNGDMSNLHFLGYQGPVIPTFLATRLATHRAVYSLITPDTEKIKKARRRAGCGLQAIC